VAVQRLTRPVTVTADVQELAPLAKTYGPHRESEHAEEWIIRDFFHDRRRGVFLDVGANDYRRDSNTYFLENSLGWSGIAIDAQAKFAEGYQRFRPHTRFVAALVADTDGASVPFFADAKQDAVASGSEAFAKAVGSRTDDPVPMRTRTLNSILAEAGVDHLDFMSMDIELGEPKALAGFDIDRYRPALVCIEAHLPIRQVLIHYFYNHHYVVVGKYLRADLVNLYFEPAAAE
jgi:Methyltransferase FkbM domain